MARRPLALAALLGVAAISLGAGCGEDEKQAYADDFQSLSRQIVALGEQVDTSITGAAEKTDAQLERQFDKLADQLGRLRRNVEGLDPPDDLAAIQAELVEAMGAAEKALRGIEQAAAGSDAAAARQATIELVRASEDVGDARRKLVKETR